MANQFPASLIIEIIKLIYTFFVTIVQCVIQRKWYKLFLYFNLVTVHKYNQCILKYNKHARAISTYVNVVLKQI